MSVDHSERLAGGAVVGAVAAHRRSHSTSGQVFFVDGRFPNFCPGLAAEGGCTLKIAVASSDGVSISNHFGRSIYFLVFEIDAVRIIAKDVRDNTYTAFAKGECEGSHHHDDQPHSHADIVNALRDCEVVLCRGMGWRAGEELRANGIEPFLVKNDISAEEAVKAYLTGGLEAAGDFCRCHE